MAAFKKKYSTNSAPPVDWLWGAILERQRVYGLSLQEMADIAGVSYGMMRRYIGESPWKWPPEIRKRLCNSLGLKINIGPECITAKDGGSAWANIS